MDIEQIMTKRFKSDVLSQIIWLGKQIMTNQSQSTNKSISKDVLSQSFYLSLMEFYKKKNNWCVLELS